MIYSIILYYIYIYREGGVGWGIPLLLFHYNGSLYRKRNDTAAAITL